LRLDFADAPDSVEEGLVRAGEPEDSETSLARRRLDTVAVRDAGWLLGREDSPWYPSMRLFRQNRPGDWDSVFDQIAVALAGRIERAAQDAFFISGPPCFS